MSVVGKPPIIPSGLPATGYLRDLVPFMVNELARRLVTDEAAPYVHLASPNGSIYKVSILDDGTLTSELIQSPP